MIIMNIVKDAHVIGGTFDRQLDTVSSLYLP